VKEFGESREKEKKNTRRKPSTLSELFFFLKKKLAEAPQNLQKQ